MQSNCECLRQRYTNYNEDSEEELLGNCINSNIERSQNYYIEKCEYSSECNITGNSVSFRIKDDENEIKADIVVDIREELKVWGKVKDCRGCEAAFLDVILVSVGDKGYRFIAETTTNSRGWYRFSVCPDDNAHEYKVFVKRY